MKPFQKVTITKYSILDRIMGMSKNTANAMAEINNFMAEAAKATDLTEDFVQKAFKKWSAKFDHNTLADRATCFRKVADHVYSRVQKTDDPLFKDCDYIAGLLDLPEAQQKLAVSAAKKAAYFNRCQALVDDEEALDIAAINSIFHYDYEDGLEIRKQVFTVYFNKLMDGITEAKSYSPEEEAVIRAMCAKLDVPYEFKNNIEQALLHYRENWAAAHQALHAIKVDIPLKPGEICYAATQAGLSTRVTVQKEDNIYDLTHRLEIDDTINFKGQELEHPKVEQEIVKITDVGNLFITNQQVIYLSNKNALALPLKDIASTKLEISLLTLVMQNGQENLIRLSDESAQVVQVLIERARAGKIDAE